MNFVCVCFPSPLFLTCHREKEHDLERRFELLNRELRAMLAIEGKTHTQSEAAHVYIKLLIL